MTAEVTTTPYDALGGETGIQRLVHRFYALMDELPEAYTVRQMHPEWVFRSIVTDFLP